MHVQSRHACALPFVRDNPGDPPHAAWDIAGSLALNPMGALLLIALVVLPLWLLADILMKGEESLHRWYTGAECVLRRKTWVSVPLIVFVIANWFWSIQKGL